MKILAVGRNYVKHIEELKNEIPESPVIFSKPETAILKDNQAFYLPDFSNDIHYEVEIVLKINKTGKYIQEKFASNYYSEIALGIDFTARDLQTKLKEKGLPWDLAKGFDNSAPISKFISIENLDMKNLNFGLAINGKTVQTGNTSNMIYSFDYLISFLSQYFTLKVGDLIFTGTPAGVGPVAQNDHLVGHINNQELLNFLIK